MYLIWDDLNLGFLKGGARVSLVLQGVACLGGTGLPAGIGSRPLAKCHGGIGAGGAFPGRRGPIHGTEGTGRG